VALHFFSFGNKIACGAGQINLITSKLQMIWQNHVGLAATSNWASQGVLAGALLLMC
jgi:hypothetical protein